MSQVVLWGGRVDGDIIKIAAVVRIYAPIVFKDKLLRVKIAIENVTG